MIRTLRALIVISVVAARPVFADEQPSPRFFIERIEVRNTSRVSPDVIVAESRLREGAEYSEAELRDAASRLIRLPFLLAADFALERGSERGRHVLVINITETRSFFVRLNVLPVLSDHYAPAIQGPVRTNVHESDAALGYRWFLGRRGALHVGLLATDDTEFTQGYTSFAVGYTAYDLFGSRAFATVNIKRPIDGDGGISPQLVAGIPLSLNQTLTAEYDETVIDYDYRIRSADRRVEQTETQRLARMTWSYNTTNHPFVPTEGSLITASPFALWRDDFSISYALVDPGLPLDVRILPIHSTTFGIETSATRYWAVTDPTSVSLGAEAGWATMETRIHREFPQIYDRRAFFGAVSGGISRSLWSAERRAQGGDSRFELAARARLRQQYRDFAFRVFEFRDESGQVTTSWVRHSSWGTVRLGVGYSW